MAKDTDGQPLLRLHMELQAGILSEILDRLQIAGQAPRFMVFRRGDDGMGFVILDFDRVNETAAAAFIPWLQQVSGVLRVEPEWRTDAR